MKKGKRPRKSDEIIWVNKDRDIADIERFVNAL